MMLMLTMTSLFVYLDFSFIEQQDSGNRFNSLHVQHSMLKVSELNACALFCLIHFILCSFGTKKLVALVMETKCVVPFIANHHVSEAFHKSTSEKPKKPQVFV